MKSLVLSLMVMALAMFALAPLAPVEAAWAEPVEQIEVVKLYTSHGQLNQHVSVGEAEFGCTLAKITPVVWVKNPIDAFQIATLAGPVDYEAGIVKVKINDVSQDRAEFYKVKVLVQAFCLPAAE